MRLGMFYVLLSNFINQIVEVELMHHVGLENVDGFADCGVTSEFLRNSA